MKHVSLLLGGCLEAFIVTYFLKKKVDEQRKIQFIIKPPIESISNKTCIETILDFKNHLMQILAAMKDTLKNDMWLMLAHIFWRWLKFHMFRVLQPQSHSVFSYQIEFLSMLLLVSLTETLFVRYWMEIYVMLRPLEHLWMQNDSLRHESNITGEVMRAEYLNHNANGMHSWNNTHFLQSRGHSGENCNSRIQSSMKSNLLSVSIEEHQKGLASPMTLSSPNFPQSHSILDQDENNFNHEKVQNSILKKNFNKNKLQSIQNRLWSWLQRELQKQYLVLSPVLQPNYIHHHALSLLIFTLKQFIFNTIFFSIMSMFRNTAKEFWFLPFIIGCIGASIASLFNNPVDVIWLRYNEWALSTTSNKYEKISIQTSNINQEMTIINWIYSLKELSYKDMFLGMRWKLLRIGVGNGIMTLCFMFGD